MSAPNDEGTTKDRRATRIVGLCFLGALIAIPPLNKHLIGPLAGSFVGAPDSITSSILAGAIGGAFFGGGIWLLGRHLTKHRRKRKDER